MSEKNISLRTQDGGAFKAYRALPECGSGPALILLPELYESEARTRELADFYAEEGYVVLAPVLVRPPRDGASWPGFQEVVALHRRFDLEQGFATLRATVEAARAMPQVTGAEGEKRVGVLGFGLGGTLACLAAARSSVDCAVAYCPVRLEDALAREGQGRTPVVLHFGGRDELVPPATLAWLRGQWAGRPGTEFYTYPAGGHDFTRQDSAAWSKPATTIARTRSLALLRKVMGPHYDYSALWDKHCEHEFVHRDADATMKTMVARPYVNNVPIMTGGVGAVDLRRFYGDHFVHVNPKDMRIVPISRTIGADRLVDEFLACFTHDVEMDWMLPGIPPTGRYVEVAVCVVVTFRGDKLCSEHLYWDQASVLVQLGVLDATGLPIAGVESARKLVDESLPSNTLMRHWAERESTPGT
jgi:carboxymethylenebutenolidase